jgi:hypothetical protein
VLKDTRRFTAIARVVPSVRFKALAIFVTPCLSLAIDFNVRKSSLVHGRLIILLFGIHRLMFLMNRTFITANFVDNAPWFIG